MHYAPRLIQPSRTFVVPLLAAALGAGVATATFAVVNIEDQPTVSLPAVESAVPATAAVAGERNDGGPAEGTAQQIMRQPAAEKFRTSYQPAPAAPATSAPRYDGGPNEGASAGAISSPPPEEGSSGAQPYGGVRP